MADGEPTRIGIPVSDIFTGVYSVIGILAALTEREKTGKGCYVDSALVDSTVGVLSNQAMNYLVSGNVPKRIGNAHANIVPTRSFRLRTATSLSRPAMTTSTSNFATSSADRSLRKIPRTRTMSAGSSTARSWSESSRRSPRA